MLSGGEMGKCDSGYREVFGYVEKWLKRGKHVNNTRRDFLSGGVEDSGLLKCYDVYPSTQRYAARLEYSRYWPAENLFATQDYSVELFMM
jgi:transcriptional regulator of aromatic amino acid metabolism